MPICKRPTPCTTGSALWLSRAYFISQGEPVNCWQWIDQLLELAGLPPVRKSLPMPVAWAAGAACGSDLHALAAARTNARM